MIIMIIFPMRDSDELRQGKNKNGDDVRYSLIQSLFYPSRHTVPCRNAVGVALSDDVLHPDRTIKSKVGL